MPWPQFLLMLQESRRFDLIDKSNLCDIHAISICNSDFYKLLKSQYRPEIYGQEELPVAPKLPGINVLAAESVEAKHSLMGMCGALRGGH